ncbi:MAG: recombinase family protein [Candidatus Accumulibacter sp.]|uniref:Recombinase family protein n=1 Tax=Candidatus Accumulibacter proximus TaxID=2954385 RepID=A0A935Q2A5_9PROT|nr:recombinase family protein [Candidatus Accumulibacter proximus]
MTSHSVTAPLAALPMPLDRRWDRSALPRRPPRSPRVTSKVALPIGCRKSPTAACRKQSRSSSPTAASACQRSRSGAELSDFSRLIEVFERNKVSFVAVAQQFNTTTSMSRLMLNALLSFAQFEREVTAERIRDHIAASKTKGMWMGGALPLGYDVENRLLVVNEAEASLARRILKDSTRCRSATEMVRELAADGHTTKSRRCLPSRRSTR